MQGIISSVHQKYSESGLTRSMGVGGKILSVTIGTRGTVKSISGRADITQMPVEPI